MFLLPALAPCMSGYLKRPGAKTGFITMGKKQSSGKGFSGIFNENKIEVKGTGIVKINLEPSKSYFNKSSS